MKLAERAGVLSLTAIALGTTIALLAIPKSSAPEPPARSSIISIRIETEPAIATCPAFVRERLLLGPSATVRCVRGHFGEPAYFALGEYTTTEPWQRLMVISEDGERILVQRTDRPLLRPAHGLATEDVEGDGFDEVVSGLEIITVHDGHFLFGVR